MRRLTDPLDEFTEIYLDSGQSLTMTGRFSLEGSENVCSRVWIRLIKNTCWLTEMINSHLPGCPKILIVIYRVVWIRSHDFFVTDFVPDVRKNWKSRGLLWISDHMILELPRNRINASLSKCPKGITIYHSLFRFSWVPRIRFPLPFFIRPGEPFLLLFLKLFSVH